MQDEAGASERAGQSVLRLDHRSFDCATRIHAVQQAAYAEEARLLGVRSFPPLLRSVGDVQASCTVFFGMQTESELIGVVEIEPNETASEIHVASLAVAPAFRGRRVGRALVSHVARRFGGCALTVSTAAANVPALALYAKLGFEEVGRRSIDAPPLLLVQLRWDPRLLPENDHVL